MADSPENDAAVPHSGAPEGAEAFDPAVHLRADGDPAADAPLYLELACSCGAVRKQFDPPAYLTRTLEVWNAQHAGPGHGVASIAGAVAEREARREAAHRAAGRAQEYQPADPGAYSSEVSAWPDLSTAGQSAQEG